MQLDLLHWPLREAQDVSSPVKPNRTKAPPTLSQSEASDTKQYTAV